MIGWTLNAAWHFIASSATLATLIGCGAVAVAVLEPAIVARFIPHLRTFAIYTAIAAFSYTSIAGKFYNDGIAVKQAEWNAAIASEAIAGEKARTDAESTVRNEPPDGVRNDPRNRDNGGKQPEGRAKSALRRLEGHLLFGRKRQP